MARIAPPNAGSTVACKFLAPSLRKKLPKKRAKDEIVLIGGRRCWSPQPALLASPHGETPWVVSSTRWGPGGWVGWGVTLAIAIAVSRSAADAGRSLRHLARRARSAASLMGVPCPRNCGSKKGSCGEHGQCARHCRPCGKDQNHKPGRPRVAVDVRAERRESRRAVLAQAERDGALAEVPEHQGLVYEGPPPVKPKRTVGALLDVLGEPSWVRNQLPDGRRKKGALVKLGETGGKQGALGDAPTRNRLAAIRGQLAPAQPTEAARVGPRPAPTLFRNGGATGGAGFSRDVRPPN